MELLRLIAHILDPFKWGECAPDRIARLRAWQVEGRDRFAVMNASNVGAMSRVSRSHGRYS